MWAWHRGRASCPSRAVAPLWAALVARLNEALGQPVGVLEPLLYGHGGGALHDVVDGSNGVYSGYWL